MAGSERFEQGTGPFAKKGPVPFSNRSIGDVEVDQVGSVWLDFAGQLREFRVAESFGQHRLRLRGWIAGWSGAGQQCLNADLVPTRRGAVGLAGVQGKRAILANAAVGNGAVLAFFGVRR